MAAAALPLAMGAMATGSLLSAAGQYSEGRIRKEESKTEAELVGVQAKQKELARTKKLNEALASQMVRAGASGVRLEGTPVQTAEEMVRMSQREQAAEDVGTRVTQRTIRSRGRQAEKLGRLGAYSSLLMSAGQAAGMAV